ncbi:PAS domain S-box protein [Desulfonatronospira sp.]|uniref:PAS domain-containing protein n=1 Tax=Desulfonatronospira sp. TaxID=1962951 RepID=UPI0025BC5F34|nr:PAS domain S-box protein [Desulfonatronospira sp.]
MTDNRHCSKNSMLLFKNDPEDCLEVLKNAPIGIFTSSPQGRFLSVNPALSHLLGYDSAEKLIDSITHICSQIYADPEEREALERILNDHGQAANYECRWMRRDGSVVWVSNSIHAVRDENGSITHYQAFVLDITCRKQNERSLYESEKRYRNLVESQNDLIVRVDPEYRFTYVKDDARHKNRHLQVHRAAIILN